MGDPRKIRKKYTGPMHPWEAKRIEEEKLIMEEYAPKNKKEIWKMKSKLRDFARQAKKLIALQTAQAGIEKKQLLQKLHTLGLLPETAKVEDVLSLTLKDIMGRRLQTVVYKKNLAGTMMQARQFIAHEHITVNNRTVNSPSYLVSRNDESSISFLGSSPLADANHPERLTAVKADGKEKGIGDKKKKPEKREEKRRSRWKRGKDR